MRFYLSCRWNVWKLLSFLFFSFLNDNSLSITAILYVCLVCVLRSEIDEWMCHVWCSHFRTSEPKSSKQFYSAFVFLCRPQTRVQQRKTNWNLAIQKKQPQIRFKLISAQPSSWTNCTKFSTQLLLSLLSIFHLFWFLFLFFDLIFFFFTKQFCYKIGQSMAWTRNTVIVCNDNCRGSKQLKFRWNAIKFIGPEIINTLHIRWTKKHVKWKKHAKNQHWHASQHRTTLNFHCMTLLVLPLFTFQLCFGFLMSHHEMNSVYLFSFCWC